MKTTRKDRDLMRQKVNVTEELLTDWTKNYVAYHSNVITESLLKNEDLGTEIVHKDRRFKIIGMTQTGSIMLLETTEGIERYGEPIYWETTRYFVQFCLDRKILEYFKIQGALLTRPRDYVPLSLYLPPMSQLKKAKVEKDEMQNDLVEAEAQPKIETYEEDNYSEETED
jgi:hypothetical protein